MLNSSRGVVEHLANVLGLQLGKVSAKIVPARILCEDLEHTGDCETHAADGRCSALDRGVDRDSLKSGLRQLHESSLPDWEPAVMARGMAHETLATTAQSWWRRIHLPNTRWLTPSA